MYRMFPVILTALVLLVPITALAANGDKCGPNFISNTVQCVAKSVYVGKDSSMPPYSQYQIAIDPVFAKNGNILLPDTIQQALVFMKKMLPNWYLHALYSSSGNNNCDVIVNGSSYAGLIAEWLWVNWRMDSSNSNLRKQFARFGIRHQDGVEQALIFGFCNFVKHGESKAIRSIKERGDQLQKKDKNKRKDSFP